MSAAIWHDIEGLLERLKTQGETPQWMPASEASIAQVEQSLGVAFSGSYREFLRRYGAGGLEGMEWCGIRWDDPRATTPGTVLGATLDARKRGLPPQFIVIRGPFEDGELFCIDTLNSASGECPVLFMAGPDADGAEFHRRAKKHTDSFVEYLRQDLEDLATGQGAVV